jgi:ATP-dependent Clp protease ATP-binding subunit ClpC
VVELAREEAGTLGHALVEPEHILLGLARQSTTRAAQTLQALGLSLEWLRSEISSTRGSGDPCTSADAPLTPSAELALKLAGQAADHLNAAEIGPEHLLLGVAFVSGEMCARVLARCHVRPEEIRDELVGKSGT